MGFSSEVLWVTCREISQASVYHLHPQQAVPQRFQRPSNTLRDFENFVKASILYMPYFANSAKSSLPIPGPVASAAIIPVCFAMRVPLSLHILVALKASLPVHRKHCCCMQAYDKAIEGELYETAAMLRDKGGLGLIGWWWATSSSHGGNQPHLLRVSPGPNRLIFRAVTPVDLGIRMVRNLNLNSLALRVFARLLLSSTQKNTPSTSSYMLGNMITTNLLDSKFLSLQII